MKLNSNVEKNCNFNIDLCRIVDQTQSLRPIAAKNKRQNSAARREADDRLCPVSARFSEVQFREEEDARVHRSSTYFGLIPRPEARGTFYPFLSFVAPSSLDTLMRACVLLLLFDRALPFRFRIMFLTFFSAPTSSC